MNIIIPLGGKGERFLKNGYTQPKPLIQIFEKCMIEYVIDNLTISSEDNVFIIYNKKLDDYHFSTHMINKYPFIHLISIEDTKGAVETLCLGIDHILSNHAYHKKCLILDCDTFYTEDIHAIFKESNQNMVFYTQNYDIQPIYSYIELNSENSITNIKEKVKISNNANTGAYAFTDITTLHKYCKHVLDQNITFNNEPYTSCVISEMVKDNHIITGVQLNDQYVFSLGTPTAVEKYIENTHAFLFDLDGTLVITDDIYFNVWSDLLSQYNIVLTTEIFEKYIQGNNDKYVLNTLLKNINIRSEDLSKLKDELFIKNINNVKIIDGVYDVIAQIKLSGHKLCIVTNCNKNVANEIVHYIHIDKNIDFIISCDDCVNGKPDSEPYKQAVNKYNIHHKKCIIFEDSKSGMLSGKGIHPKLIIGVETIYNKKELTNLGANMSIKDYSGVNIHQLLTTDSTNTVNILKEMIIKNSNIFDIKELLIDENKLKGGFISDVISYHIITTEITYSLVLKYENTQENNLSSMAKKLELYEREYYFYTNISPYININIPKFYHLVVDDRHHTVGVVLENLLDKKYRLNLNLNLESIDTTLKIVDRMARMHSSFWNKDLQKIFPNLKGSKDVIFYPFFTDFMGERYELFKRNWHKTLNAYQIDKCDEIYKNFGKIQERFANSNHLTFIHGDIKSPNIFYDVDNHNEPWFIDWQHCAIGKGAQDLIFFVIESFDITNIKSVFTITTEYYYKKLLEYGITDYSYEEYKHDLYDAICYTPFFTSIWFGTTPQDELIDKNFPYFFISKLFYLIEYINKYAM